MTAHPNAAEPASLRVPLSDNASATLAEVFAPLGPGDAIRDLLLLTWPMGKAPAGTKTGGRCRVTCVRALGGILQPFTVTGGGAADAGLPHTEPESGAPDLVAVEDVPEVWSFLDELYALVPSHPQVEGPWVGRAPVCVEFVRNRTGEAWVDVLWDADVPPAESGAAHHVWHDAPGLDDVMERLAPDPWWARAGEWVATLLGRVRTAFQ